jgi:hypothetical protein
MRTTTRGILGIVIAVATGSAACGNPTDDAVSGMPKYQVTKVEGHRIEATLLDQDGRPDGRIGFTTDRPVLELAMSRAKPEKWDVDYAPIRPGGPRPPGIDVDTCSALEADCTDLCEELPLPTQYIVCLTGCIAGYLICRQL